ncbi:MAG: hypothetical protein WAN65_04685 [Candidatus Sulfotelmatobacter sp.]
MIHHRLTSLIPAPPGWQVLVRTGSYKNPQPEFKLCPVVGFALQDLMETTEGKAPRMIPTSYKSGAFEAEPTEAVAVFLHAGKLVQYDSGSSEDDELLLAPGEDPKDHIAKMTAKWEIDYRNRQLQIGVRATFKILLDEGKTIEECMAVCPVNWKGKLLKRETVQEWIDKGMPL